MGLGQVHYWVGKMHILFGGKNMKIMIHACKNRIFYVNDFLVPYLLEQGYDKGDILVYLDEEKGCLKAHLDAFKNFVPDDKDYLWHLQDDVLPRSDFYFHAEHALKDFMRGGIVCGFGNKEFYKREKFGYAYNSNDMFYSFPCIRIPNYICHDFVRWFNERAVNRVDLQKYIVNNKFVDYLFKVYVDLKFIGETHDMGMFNYRPCLVDHVDEYCGGSTVNKDRKKPARALIFEDSESKLRLKRWFENQKEYKKEKR